MRSETSSADWFAAKCKALKPKRSRMSASAFALRSKRTACLWPPEVARCKGVYFGCCLSRSFGSSVRSRARITPKSPCLAASPRLDEFALCKEPLSSNKQSRSIRKCAWAEAQTAHSTLHVQKVFSTFKESKIIRFESQKCGLWLYPNSLLRSKNKRFRCTSSYCRSKGQDPAHSSTRKLKQRDVHGTLTKTFLTPWRPEWTTPCKMTYKSDKYWGGFSV